MQAPTITALNYRATTLLLLGLLVVIAPHLAVLPGWIGGVAIAIGVWRWRASLLGWRVPTATIRIAITLLVIALVFAQFGTVAGRDAGIALLVAMMGLKLLELRERRDVLVLIFLGYFILVTHFLYSQTIPMAIYVFSATWLLVSLHIHLTHMDAQPLKVSLRTGAMLLGQALPLMLALFVLFPRLPGPIWNLPKDAYAGMTGLDDSMSPGQISQLSLSDEIAFRVKFDDAIPPADRRYWRGPVLTVTDGRSWTPSSEGYRRTWESPPFEWRRDPISYTVTLEPHNRRWLFALDLPATATEYGALNSDYQITSSTPIRQRLRYHMVSFTDYNTGELSAVAKNAALRLPADRNPRTLELGRQLRQQSASGADTVRRALQLFRNQPFVYTLQPPLLTSNSPSDEFLFATRRGFCEHFSSSFVMLMRAAGIPARVVTGYQGGELNPVGDYLVVRQRDAHAWAEVWLPEQGWLRVDPTAAVAPERVETGIDTAAAAIGGAVRFRVDEAGELAKLITRMRMRSDAINNAWNQFILGYGPEQQAEFLRSFGLDISSWKQLAWTLGIVVGGFFLILAGFVLFKRERVNDPVQKCFLAFCRKLAKQGIERHDNETASDYVFRVSQQRPELAGAANTIVKLYLDLRYNTKTQPQQLSRLRRLITSFKP